MIVAGITRIREALEAIEESRRGGLVIDNPKDSCRHAHMSKKAKNNLNTFSMSELIELENIKGRMRPRIQKGKSKDRIGSEKPLPKEDVKPSLEKAPEHTFEELQALMQKSIEEEEEENRKRAAVDLRAATESPMDKPKKPQKGEMDCIEIQSVHNGFIVTAGDEIYVAHLGTIVETIGDLLPKLKEVKAS